MCTRRNRWVVLVELGLEGGWKKKGEGRVRGNGFRMSRRKGKWREIKMV